MGRRKRRLTTTTTEYFAASLGLLLQIEGCSLTPVLNSNVARVVVRNLDVDLACSAFSR
jgi:hypothetical protein